MSDTPLDARLSISPTTTLAWSAAEDLALATRLGVPRATVSAAKLEQAGWTVAEAHRRVSDHGLPVDSVYQPGFFDLADRVGWPRLTERMVAAVRVAATLGSPFQLTTGGARGMSHRDATRAFADAVAPVARAAREHGVPLLLEPARTQFAHVTFIHTMRDGLELLEAIGLEARLVFDVTHCWWEPGLDALLQAHADAIGSLHLADLALTGPLEGRLVPGDGDLRLAELVGALLAGGFDGAIEIEVLGPAIDREGVEPAVRRSLQYATALLAELR